MTEPLVSTIHIRAVTQNGHHMAYVADAHEPVIYASQTLPASHTTGSTISPALSALEHIVSATTICMYGTLDEAITGRKVPLDYMNFLATAEGHIVRTGATLRVASIVIHYELTVPPAFRDATIRALRFHPRGCPVHLSLKESIVVTWDATLHCADDVVRVRE